MIIKRRISRRHAVKYLLAFLATVIGSRAVAQDKQKLPSSSRVKDLSAPALSGQSRLATEAVVRSPLASSSFLRVESNFKSIYSDPKQRDRFYLFLQNVYHLYPENQFHQLILDVTAEYDTDQEIYQELLKRLPQIKPLFSTVTYGLPSLSKQKEEMARQTAELLGSVHSANGYIEIGTTGRYFNGLKQRVNLEGPIYIVNDLAPAYSLEAVVERGQLSLVGSYVPMGNYEPFAGLLIPPESVELITNFIGFHHAPADRLERFVQSIWTVLKPGGRLVLRDHDVDSPEMDAQAALAHDVFNAGLGISWEDNHAQIRNFRSVPQIEEYLGKIGFERSETRLLQDHDPTRNTLMLFVKPGTRTV